MCAGLSAVVVGLAEANNNNDGTRAIHAVVGVRVAVQDWRVQWLSKMCLRCRV